MLVDNTLTMAELQERYPDPPDELVTGTKEPLIHHCYAYGQMVYCLQAIKDALVVARKVKDNVAVTHLVRDQKMARAQDEQRAVRARDERASSATRLTKQPTGVPSPRDLERGITRARVS